MKNRIRVIILAVVVVALAIPLAQGQKKKQGAASPKYDPAAEIRVKGTIREVTFYACPVSGRAGAHLRLETLKQTLEVHVAPSWFIEKYNIKFALGEKVEIVGVEYTRGGQAGLMARQVEGATGIYSFRNPKGEPLWLPE